MQSRRDPRAVFLNVPFDREYEPVFVGLIAALVHLGLRPTTVLELGLAVAVARTSRGRHAHAFALLEATPFRLQRSLSDMNGYDAIVHGGSRAGAVRCMFELFADTAGIDLRRVQSLAEDLAVTHDNSSAITV